MISNINRLEKDLIKLIFNGNQLINAIQKHVDNKQYEIAVKNQLTPEKAENLLKNTPDFLSEYDLWYSESLVFIKQILPDRLENFKSLYEKPKTRKNIDYETYVIQDLLQGITVRFHGEVKVGPYAAIPKFKQQVYILESAKSRFKSSLFEIRQLVQADLFDSEIDAAQELLKNRFYRASGAIAGVVLEKHLQQVCNDHNIKVKKHPGISVLNEALKSNLIIDVPQWRHISMLGDIRNVCDHNNTKDPTQAQVQDLIDGTSKILKTVS